MRNRYPGNCLLCGKRVGVGKGFFERITAKLQLRYGVRNRWNVRCTDCVGKGHKSEQEAVTEGFTSYPHPERKS